MKSGQDCQKYCPSNSGIFMKFDKLENLEKYKDYHPSFERAIDFLRSADLEALSIGKHLIDGENLFVSVAEYTTKEQGYLEAHKDYIDIQLITKGSEKIGHAKLSGQKIKEEYDPVRDIAFYYGECEYIDLMPGYFSVFSPDDLHMPGIIKDEPQAVKKIVVKVRVQE